MLIFLYGEDTFRSRQKLKELKDKFLREVDPGGTSLTALDGETVALEKISEAIGPVSLFAKRRMIVIENIFLNKSQTIFKKLFEYLKGKEKENIIIFRDRLSAKEKLPAYKSGLFKFLSKQKYSQEFKALSNTEIVAWVKKEMEKRGGKISQSAVILLSSFLGNNLWQIDREIDKLISYKASGKLSLGSDAGAIIGEEDVKNLAHGRFDENIFALTDALSARNKRAAVKIFEEQIEAGLTDGYLLSMIARQFRIMLRVKQALESGLSSRQIISLLKLHPFVAQKSIAQVRNFSIPVLKNILNKLTEIDYLAKTGKSDVKTMLSLLLAKL
ncbi:DNA polymerase III subunit delta [Candidatus Falkowbacteria bacterium]|nr:DNA polymerase III subunit delta [Candidatus Falkowbacteria bacterium]